MKKILLTGANGMLASDFQKYCSKIFEIIPFDKQKLDITNISNIEKIISDIKPDIILNCAAYTQVDNAEDVGKLLNYEINTLGTYNLAKISNKYNIDYITISTDYVFDGKNQSGYNENDICNPINDYGMSKYLGEKLTLEENKNSIIVRTSWLYGGGKEFKNFVNTMLRLAETKSELKIVNDQFGIPTYTVDLSLAISKVIENIEKYRGKILHFSNLSEKAITWFDFASQIFKLKPSPLAPLPKVEGKNKEINVIPCSSLDFPTKAMRPMFSKLINNNDIELRDWKEGLSDYLDNL
ncbi:MAG: dTDP-4-dehydrorhamnose reductase [Candidatus Gracilibacteria bacterium]